MRIFLKYFLMVLLVAVLVLLILYGYLLFISRQSYQVEWGISFSKQHSLTLGLDWQQVYLKMLDELKPKYLRISANWDEAEAEVDKFELADVDWQMQEAEKRGVKVVLVIGQKTPRWPECHVPVWANQLSQEEYRKELFDYVKTVVERYKSSQALEMWQVENEPYIRFSFGSCQHYIESLVAEEIQYVKLLDLNHKILVTDSGELSTWQEAIKAGDFFGTTIYRIVRTPQGWHWNYDWLPAGYYNLKAKFFGKDISEVFVSELQAEPWFNNSNPNLTSIAEQERSMNPERLKKHLDYVTHIGFPRSYLWGVEWWYWMKDVKGDSRYWEIIRQQLADKADTN